jgi:RNA polymerase sigma-70 factor, ECF subfamily
MKLGEVYAQQLGYVRGCLRGLGARPSELDDMVQEVFIRLAAHPEAFDQRRPIRPFLQGLAFRVFSEFSRRERRQKLRALPWASSPSRPDESLERNQAALAISKALERVPPPRRAIFELHEIEGISVPELAQRFDLPLNTAYSQLRLSKRDFRSAILVSEAFEPRTRPTRKR